MSLTDKAYKEPPGHFSTSAATPKVTVKSLEMHIISYLLTAVTRYFGCVSFVILYVVMQFGRYVDIFP
jgi:hypothetical protein